MSIYNILHWHQRLLYFIHYACIHMASAELIADCWYTLKLVPKWLHCPRQQCRHKGYSNKGKWKSDDIWTQYMKNTWLVWYWHNTEWYSVEWTGTIASQFSVRYQIDIALENHFHSIWYHADITLVISPNPFWFVLMSHNNYTFKVVIAGHSTSFDRVYLSHCL